MDDGGGARQQGPRAGAFGGYMDWNGMNNPPVMTKLAFYAWLWLLLISLATFALGLSGHVFALLAWPWLSLKAQAVIHTGIPVFLTAVKAVTVPVLLVLTPLARHHPTFEDWTKWSKKRFGEIEGAAKLPLRFIKSLFSRNGSKEKSGEGEG
jgi:hypothetical protein